MPQPQTTNYKPKTGFTLIELMIVVAIVAIVSSVVFSNMPLYKGTIALDREAGTMALTLRKAQQYSVAVRKFDDTITTIPAGCNEDLYKVRFPAYGVHLNLGSPSTYTIYADPDCDGVSNSYPTAGSNGDLIETISLGNRITIDDICINIDPPLTSECASLTGNFDQADIWYVRPGPQIVFTLYKGGAVVPPPPTSLEIVLKLPEGNRRSVIARTTGQVSVQHKP
jgi:prepilin-type N-terminal cleavage/methylation domain-containing protein